MARVLKFAWLTAAAMLGLLLLCIVLAAWFFNPNAYQPQIERWLEQQTGRSFTLDGELGWQLWPRLSLTLPHTYIGSAPGFAFQGLTEPEFAEWQQADISVRLWPLLQRRLAIGAVTLRGLRVSLRRDAQGRDNWQDLLQRFDSNDTPSSWRFDSLTSLQVQDAQLQFDDQRAQRLMQLELMSLQTGVVRFDHPVLLTLTARLRMQSSTQSLELPFKLALQLETDKDLQQLQLHDLQGSAQFTSTDLFGSTVSQAVPMSIALTQLTWQAAQQQVQAQSLHIQIGVAQLAGQFSATRLMTRPQVDAMLQLDVPNLRPWLQSLGVTVPATRDATVLQAFQSSLQLSGTAEDLQAQVMRLQLDQTQLVGTAHWLQKDDAPRYTFDLHADQLNLDRYLPVTAPSNRKALSPLPIDWLRSLHARGKLQIDQAQLQGVRAQGLKIELDGA